MNSRIKKSPKERINKLVFGQNYENSIKLDINENFAIFSTRTHGSRRWSWHHLHIKERIGAKRLLARCLQWSHSRVLLNLSSVEECWWKMLVKNGDRSLRTPTLLWLAKRAWNLSICEAARAAWLRATWTRWTASNASCQMRFDRSCYSLYESDQVIKHILCKSVWQIKYSKRNEIIAQI